CHSSAKSLPLEGTDNSGQKCPLLARKWQQGPKGSTSCPMFTAAPMSLLVSSWLQLPGPIVDRCLRFPRVGVRAMLFAAAVVLVGARATAQCPDPMDAPFDSYPLVYHPIVAPAGVITVGCPGGIELPCIMSNEAVQINVTEGNQYQFSTCCLTCSPIWDTEITLWSSTGVQLGYDDGDGSCGSASFMSWTATYTGTVTLTVAESPGCGLIPENPNTCVALSVTCTPPFVELCYSMTPTPYLAEPYAGTPLYMSDDTHSGVVNIGFDFCFDGVVYNQCVISSNNYVTFDLWKAGTYSPWVTVGVPSVAPTQPPNARP